MMNIKNKHTFLLKYSKSPFFTKLLEKYLDLTRTFFFKNINYFFNKQ